MQNITTVTCNQHKKIVNETFYFFFSYLVLEIQCILYAYGTSQFKLAAFQGFCGHTWRGATGLAGAYLEQQRSMENQGQLNHSLP